MQKRQQFECILFESFINTGKISKFSSNCYLLSCKLIIDFILFFNIHICIFLFNLSDHVKREKSFYCGEELIMFLFCWKIQHFFH